MNAEPTPKRIATRRRKGIALVTVLAMMALITIIVMAFLTSTDSELQATQISANGETARQLAENAPAVVVGQIQAGSRQVLGNGATREFHATQPGVVRQYLDTGALYAGYKLYSDSEMVVTAVGVTGERALSNDAPPGNWKEDPARYVDLNEPVVRAKAGSAVPSVFFPVVDPRAAHNNGATAENDVVEGFEYFDAVNLGRGSGIDGVVTSADAGGDPNSMRLPMPVEWLYVLKNGHMGSLDAAQKFQPVGNRADGTPSEANPIIGRIAFWTDDESCKVNINTASEPAYWAPPFFFHQRDSGFNDAPPVQFEYQRYPGHPATVALSSILYPNQDLDTYGLDEKAVESVLSFRESIYALAPKINNGGSRGGSLPFDPDDLVDKSAPPIALANISAAMAERLYVSLDELRFADTMSGNKRLPNALMSPSGSALLSPAKLEQSRFFLTANSRAPEFSIFGVPRIAMWPIPVLSNSGPLGENQTIHDKLIRFCATIKGTSAAPGALYAFQRQDAHSQLVDIKLPRNDQLLNYLYKMMGKVWPGAASGGGSSFLVKYGEDDTRQIAVQIFDYIRCINLYDSALSLEGKEIVAKANPSGDQNNLRDYTDAVLNKGGTLAGNPTGLYEERDRIRAQKKFITYTEPHYRTRRTNQRTGDTSHAAEIPDVDAVQNGYPGHGQVSPSRWNVHGMDYKGFGRSVTFSEVGLHFICTADGRNDFGSFETWADSSYQAKSGVKSGGRSAPKTTFPDDYEPTKTYKVPTKGYPNAAPKQPEYWYSNYPPFPRVGDGNIANVYGIEWNDRNGRSPKNPANHPGLDPANWNGSLDDNTPLKETEKRIQCMLQIELFCPALGWTGIDPEYTLVLSGDQVAGIEIEGQAVFSTTADMPIKSGRATYSVENFTGLAQRVGGSASTRNMVADRRAKPIGRMTDPLYDSTSSSQIHGQLINMDFISNYKTVNREEFRFEVKAPLKIKVYDTHDWKSREPIQEIELNFPGGEQVAPTPSLVNVSSPYRINVNQTTGDIDTWNALQAPRSWSFSFGGVIGRFNGSAAGYINNPNSVTLNNGTLGIGGRLRSASFGTIPGGAHTTTAFGLPLQYYQKDNNGVAAVTSMSHMAQLIYGIAITGNTFYRVGGIKIDRSVLNTPDEAVRNFGYDVVRSMIPRYGDYRLMAARRYPPEEQWVAHPMWQIGDNDVVLAHNISGYRSDGDPGFDRSGSVEAANDAKYRLTAGAAYLNHQEPDMPHNEESMKATNRYRDWDNGISNARDGAYINKPDEGNFSKFPFWIDNAVRWVRNGYLYDSAESSGGSPSFFTPNRMVSSAGMMGSLPTGVWGSKSPPSAPDMARNGVAWRTLLFRPHTPPVNSTPTPVEDSATHPGALSPADHFLMDLFCMPVVEPYAISEPLSQAGKVNVNYQILPFTHIKRATGLHAVLKGELMAAIKRDDAPFYKTRPNNNSKWPPSYWSEKAADTNGANAAAKTLRNFYRKIDANETLKELDDRFSLASGTAGKEGLLRSASQFCEIFLIPKDAPATVPTYANMNVLKPTIATDRKGKMNTFWDTHSLTGDNLRERPYANIYSRITTRTNTFRVFVRAQTVQKARSAGPDTIDLTRDRITGEYRGSRLLERSIDPAAAAPIPDYAGISDPYASTPLEEFYRFRVLESKRFDP